MLSRVANSLFWLSRYVERAENVTRLVEINQQFALDDHDHLEDPLASWRAVLLTTATEGFDDESDKLSGPNAVAKYITLDPSNPQSIRRSIENARENARMVRDQIPEKMWLELNAIYLFLRGTEVEEVWNRDPEIVFRKVIDFSLRFQGLADATVLQDEGWRFLQLGKFLERADQSSRILDMLTFTALPDKRACSAILGACSGKSSFRVEFLGALSMENVAQFILFSEAFPRSVRFCIRRVDETLHSISGVSQGAFSNEAERLAGSVLAQINFCNLGDIFPDGLHDYIDQIQIHLNNVGQAIFETYVLLPSEIHNVTRMDGVQLQWSKQQQQ